MALNDSFKENTYFVIGICGTNFQIVFQKTPFDNIREIIIYIYIYEKIYGKRSITYNKKSFW